ncbi:hypothetical protein J2W30_003231 [Variovorax boronicumulans]|uniref:hypothetical protein n=1 Tax=Variovorax boronicumulans TaxID=436515 RepID=UPI0027807049|nr:hypothetical protein [Variovorax boronicumulans]MDQ0035463.1 hypothetical protein [Variovorax boronicumulans]
MTSTLPSPSACQEREAFEDYARRDGMDVAHRVVDNGLTYLNSTTEHAWQFWQASRRHLPEINISRYDEADYGGMKPKAKGEWVRYEDAQEAVLRALKVVRLKEAKASIERKRYATLVLKAYDEQDRQAQKPLIEKRAEVERKARKSL